MRKQARAIAGSRIVIGSSAAFRIDSASTPASFAPYIVLSDRNVTASTYHPHDPMQATRAFPAIPPEPTVVQAGISRGGSRFVVMALMMAIVITGCLATVRCKTK